MPKLTGKAPVRTNFAELEKFLALEAPFLLQTAHDLSRRGAENPEEELLAALEKQMKAGAELPVYPEATTHDAVAWQRETFAELIRGFFRRQEIKASLTADERLHIYRTMVLTRTLDTLLKKLFNEKKIAWEGYPSPQKGFRAWGQEAEAALVIRLRRSADGDIVCPLIRGLPVTLMYMDDPEHVVLVQTGKKGTPMDGRDLHVGDFSRGVLPPTAPLAIGTQTLVGIAHAFKLRKEDRVAVSFMGEGGTSLGEWHEAINFAAVRKLNMVFVVENNHWALGTHWREQTAAPRFALKAAGYGMPWVTIFGNEADEVAAAGTWAAERARSGKGPALVELVTYRRSGHAHHDDDRFHGAPSLKGYEIEEEKKTWEAADPIALYEERLKSEGLLNDAKIREVREEVQRRVDAAEKKGETAPWPTADDFLHCVYAPRRDPVPTQASEKKKLMGYDEAVRQAMIELMEKDERVFVVGEDVGGRYGGAFGVTRGLAKQFGSDRCLNAILAESAIVGCGVGAAIMGMRPIVEMQFADFLAPGFNALVNNAAKIYWRWGRPVGMVVRLPYGGATGTMNRLLGGGPFHSQCPENWFLRTPGWKVVAPATPSDAKGLMVAAVRDENPVIFLESKGLYSFFRDDLREEVPLGVDFEVPLGKAVVRREGKDITCITYGSMVWTALSAADRLSRESGMGLEVIDLRTLWPLDEEAILKSVAKTHRAMIVHEDTKRSGYGGEIAAILAEKAIWDLDAPVVRVAGPDTPAPYAPPLEFAFLPKPDDVFLAAMSLMEKS